MATKEEIQSLLRHFKEKMKVWKVLFRDDRGKNAQTLADLEIRPIEREELLQKLSYADYCSGPHKESLYKGADLWVFGKELKKNEIYIKISIGFVGGSVICVSFHIAESKMKYPYKKHQSK